MKTRTFLTTLLLFLLFFNGAICAATVFTLKTSLGSAKEQCLAEHYVVASALLRDMQALAARGADPGAALAQLMRPYSQFSGGRQAGFALYQGEICVYSGIPDTAAPPPDPAAPAAGARTLQVQSSAPYYVSVAGRLPEPFGAYTLLYQASLQETIGAWQRMCFVLYAAGVVFSLLLALCLRLLLGRLFRPLEQIHAASKSIASGDYGRRLPVQGKDELAGVAQSFNHMAEEVQAQVAALSEAAAQKQQFADNLAHELRTPLTAIRGWGETMLMDENIDHATLETGMGVIMRETERLSDMVEELLDFSRMQSGRMKLVKSKMDVLAELSEAVIMYTERAKREGMLLIYDEPDLFVPVFGDRGKLRQVFINVIDNALKYSDPGDTTTVSARVEGNNIIIEVEDTGCGISAADLPKIKTKFYKANLTRRGSGIGLAVADEIIQMHGGRLDVSSVEGEGTTVTITLPIMDRGDDSTQIAEATAEKAAPPSDAAVHLNKLDLSDIEDN